jgi:hypothetical protein
MELTVRRGTPIGVAIPGKMLSGGVHICFTLERLEVAIPEGRYQITMYDSPHFGRLMPLLVDVPERSGIEIHYGNYPEQSDGCILVGETQDQGTGDVYQSRRAFDELFNMLQNALNNGACWITVQYGQAISE